MKADCSALRAPAVAASICNPGYRPTCRYRLARPISTSCGMRASHSLCLPSGAFKVSPHAGHCPAPPRMKASCSALCAPAAAAGINNPPYRATCRYRLARPISTSCGMQASHSLCLPSGAFIIKNRNCEYSSDFSLRKMGLEPTRHECHKILSLARLPVPTLPHLNAVKASAQTTKVIIAFSKMVVNTFLKKFKK